MESILRLASRFEKEIVRLRREFHMYPELGYEEYETSQRISRELAKAGLDVREGVAKTGVVGLLAGDKPGKTVALRADMDALPVEEQTGLPFSSRVKGKMHACGHDAHMAVVLGAAMILKEMRSGIAGNVKFIFQPSEEERPGGATPMIEEGVLKNPNVDVIFGIHCDPSLPAGKFGFRNGVMMAQADDVVIVIRGTGGHAARPHLTVDAIVTAAQAIMALQTIVSRKVDPVQPAVLSLCTIHGGVKSNVMCDRVEIEGTVRTLDPALSRKISGMIRKVLEGVTRSAGASYELTYTFGYPPLVNDPEVTDFARRVAGKMFGRRAVVDLKQPVMGGEDFACYLKKVPGSFIRMGIANPKKGVVYPWHHARFTIDEDVLVKGAALLAGLTVEYLDTAISIS